MRGFRIELGEVETALLTHARVTEAVVMLRNFADHRDGDGQLVAYVVAEGEAPAASDLRAYLRQKLPEFMIPSTFVMLAEMPLTASGKVNRLALPEPWRGAAAEDFIAPRTATEDVLANIWAAELNLNAVGVNDDDPESARPQIAGVALQSVRCDDGSRQGCVQPDRRDRLYPPQRAAPPHSCRRAGKGRQESR